MKQTVHHQLSMEEARQRAKAALAEFQARFPHANLTARWHGEDAASLQFTVRGFTLRPHVSLRPGAIDVELDVPLLARPLEGKARARIAQELGKWLQPRHA